MNTVITHRLARLLRWTESGRDLAPLLMRLYFGYFWLETGWAKLHNIDAFTQRFMGWGIPLPHLSAVVSAFTEFGGGLLLMLGLCTRLAMLPMIFNMLVAFFVVVIPQLNGFDSYFEIDEPLYALIFFWFLMAGPGRLSVDHLLFGRLSAPRGVVAA